MIFLSVVLFYFGSAAPIENAFELEEIFLDIRSIRGPRESFPESSGDNQESEAAERSLLLSTTINGEIGDQDGAENGSGDASIRSLFKFEGSADLALTGRSLYGYESSGDLALTGLILPFNESSGDGIDGRSLFGFEGSGVAERALVFISEESEVFSGDNEEEFADTRSLVTPNPAQEEVVTVYDYEYIAESFSGDEVGDDEAEERSLLTDVWQVALEADDMLNRVVEESDDDEDSSFQKIYLSLALIFIFLV